jgi:hypothetical protein
MLTNWRLDMLLAFELPTPSGSVSKPWLNRWLPLHSSPQSLAEILLSPDKSGAPLLQATLHAFSLQYALASATSAPPIGFAHDLRFD